MDHALARRDGARSVVLLTVFTAAMFAVLALTTATSSAPLLGAAPALTANLGVSTGVAIGIWDAFNSPWAMALSVLLVPLGFGAWAVTIKLTFAALVRTIGIAAARTAALAF